MAELYTCMSGFATPSPTGEMTRVSAGDVAEAGHWVLNVLPNAWRPFEVKFLAGTVSTPVAKPAEQASPVVKAPVAKG